MFNAIYKYRLLRKARKMSKQNEVAMATIFGLAKLLKVDPIKLVESIDDEMDKGNDPKTHKETFAFKVTEAMGKSALEHAKKQKKQADFELIKERQERLRNM